MWSDDKSIAVGGGEKFGFYLFNDFTCGKTDKCTTFMNEKLSTNEFKIDSLEVWGTVEEV